jgi:hypothetical protein
LDRKSPLINSHHLSFHAKACVKILERNEPDLHYSSYLAFSKADYARVKAILLKSLKDIQMLVRDSESEELYGFGMDLFKI